MKKDLFIPEVKVIDGTKTPSTPFYTNEGKPLFLLDVIRVKIKQYYNEDNFLSELTHYQSPETYTPEYFLVELKEGKYLGTSNCETKFVELYNLDEDCIELVGSAITDPKLIDLLVA